MPSALSYCLQSCLKMHRSDAIKAIMKQVKDEIVVSNIGDPSKEVYHTNDRPKNFYMLGSLGLASSISLGLALSQREKVICMDGDGSLLVNLGSLATIANQNPENLIIIALDNGSYGTTGNQRTYTSDLTDLEKVAKSCGIKNTYKIRDEKELFNILNKCLDNHILSFIHVIIEPNSPRMENIPLEPTIIKSRFMKSLKHC